MLIAVGVTSFPELAIARVECRSPRRCTSAMITVRPPRVMFAVPVMAARRETLLPESLGHVRHDIPNRREAFWGMMKNGWAGCGCNDYLEQEV
jgi:hypothetical protein